MPPRTNDAREVAPRPEPGPAQQARPRPLLSSASRTPFLSFLFTALDMALFATRQPGSRRSAFCRFAFPELRAPDHVDYTVVRLVARELEDHRGIHPRHFRLDPPRLRPGFRVGHRVLVL